MRIWQEFLEEHEPFLTSKGAKSFLSCLHLVHFDARNLYLEASDPFALSFFEEHIRPLAMQKLGQKNKQPLKIHISLKGEGFEKKKREKKAAEETKTFSLPMQKLNPEHTLETYLFGKDQDLLKELLSCLLNPSNQTVFSEKDLESFNPVYIYGPKGSGKTHLLSALAQEFKKKGARALYVSADRFFEQVVYAIANFEMPAFREIYRQADILLMDDVHLLAKKFTTQEEFFHTFNTLHLNQKTILLSSKAPQKDLHEIEERLISRFQWGITFPIPPLDQEEIKKLFEERLKKRNFPLHKTALETLLTSFDYNLPSILEALDALILRLHLNYEGIKTSTMLTSTDITYILSDLLRKEKDGRLTEQKIMNAVASEFGIHTTDLLSSSKLREITLPRHLAIYLIRKHLSLSLMQIGSLFKRDHSTILSSIKSIEAKIEEKKDEVLSTLQVLEKKLLRNNFFA